MEHKISDVRQTRRNFQRLKIHAIRKNSPLIWKIDNLHSFFSQTGQTIRKNHFSHRRPVKCPCANALYPISQCKFFQFLTAVKGAHTDSLNAFRNVHRFQARTAVKCKITDLCDCVPNKYLIKSTSSERLGSNFGHTIFHNNFFNWFIKVCMRQRVPRRLINRFIIIHRAGTRNLQRSSLRNKSPCYIFPAGSLLDACARPSHILVISKRLTIHQQHLFLRCTGILIRRFCSLYL